MIAKPTDFQSKDLKAGLTKSFIFNKKTYAYPASNDSEITANALQQTAYGMNRYHDAKAYINMREFTQASLVTQKDAFLRSGGLERRYSELYSEELSEWPKVGQSLAPTATYMQTMHDEHTGKNTYKRVQKVDQRDYVATEAFLDYDLYRDGIEQVTTGTALSKARDYNLIAGIYCCAAAPGFTLTTDRNIARFLDSTLTPVKEPQKTYFDKEKNLLYKHIIKEDIIGQVQAKHLNVQRYSTDKFAMPYLRNELKSFSKIGENDAQANKLYLVKSDSKVKYPDGLSVFVCYLAFTNAIKETVVSMTTIDTPTNRASFDPYKTQLNSTDFEDYGITTPDDLQLIMNPHDYSFISQGIENTSEHGNFKITLDDILSKGVKLYLEDTIPFGQAIIQQKGTFEIVEFHDSQYVYNAEWFLGRQYGRIGMGKVKVWKGRQWKKLVPADGGFIPSSSMTDLILAELTPT